MIDDFAMRLEATHKQGDFQHRATRARSHRALLVTPPWTLARRHDLPGSEGTAIGESRSPLGARLLHWTWIDALLGRPAT